MVARRQRLLKHALYALVALGLFGLAALVMFEGGTSRTERARVQFPHGPRPHEIERQRRRSTLAAPRPASQANEPASDTPPARLDPLHVALSGAELALVMEMGALRDAPLGRMLLACLSPEQSRELREIEEQTGVRWLEQVDRVALTDVPGEEAPVLVLSGELGGFDPGVLGEGVVFESAGENARIVRKEDRAVALWGDDLMLVGSSTGVREALGRLGAEQPLGSGMEDEAYGEIYGRISGGALSRLLPESVREHVKGAADQAMLHVDATSDLLLVADVYGERAEPLRDLATTIGGALALGRLQAVREDEPVLAALLDESRVMPSDGSFQVEMALPLAVIEEQLGECARGAAELP